MARLTPESIEHVLAATVQQEDFDGRISSDNKAWAKDIPVPDEPNRCKYVVDRYHPGLTDLFVKKIRKRMKQLGTDNMSAFLRKMAIDGYIVKLELPELKEMITLLHRSSSNLNQIAKRVNGTIV